MYKRQALGKDAEMPEDGYYGPDIISLGKMMAEQYQDQFVDKLDAVSYTHLDVYKRQD